MIGVQDQAIAETGDHHQAEVRQGSRFEFGKNWQRFLTTLTDERIAIAERSLADFLELPRLDGMTFLDVGSGSGLFSLVARRLGATVTSFDYDPQSVACTTELRRRYYPDDTGWRVLRGSVLDPQFLANLGQFDVVYSWGVLHHTGAMATALANVKPLVPVGGRLFIAIYNDLGEVTDRWWRAKRLYNALPKVLRLPYALTIIGAAETRSLIGHARQRDLHSYFRVWTDYQNVSARGMSRWHDWIDWIGGFPYERASVETIVDLFAADGFLLTKIGDRSDGYGCNEFVFRRVAAAGSVIDQPVPGSRLMARRYGRRLMSVEPVGDGSWHAKIAAPQAAGLNGEWLLLQGDQLLGEIPIPTASGEMPIPAEVAKGDLSAGLLAVKGRHEPLPEPFTHQRGAMWAAHIPQLAALADNAGGDGQNGRSPVFVFENGRQLSWPHSEHAAIAKHGGGRFSHWGDFVYFAASDGSNPNNNGRRYSMICAEPFPRT
jgi:2-polyprenyl-3-methyl-5-hydroxy-6-metoxy-1,4-benzoquinol methylase